MPVRPVFRRLRLFAPAVVTLLIMSACSPSLIGDFNPVFGSDPERLVDTGNHVVFVTDTTDIRSYDKETGEFTLLGQGSGGANGAADHVLSDLLPYDIGVGPTSVVFIESIDEFRATLAIRNPTTLGYETVGEATGLDGAPALIDQTVWFPGWSNFTTSLARLSLAQPFPEYFPVDGRIREFAKPATPGQSTPFFIGDTDSTGTTRALYEFNPVTGGVTMLSQPATTMHSLVEVEGTHSLAMVTNESGSERLELINPNNMSDRVVVTSNETSDRVVSGDRLWYIGAFNGQDDNLIYEYNTISKSLVQGVLNPGTERITSLGKGFSGGELRLYFGAGGGTDQGNELYSFDPTSPPNCSTFGFCAAQFEGEINPGAAGSFPAEFLGFDNTLFMAATRDDVDRELFFYNT